MGEGAVADFPSVEQATRSPLARALFAVPDVSRVFFGSDFFSVTKTENADWKHMKVPVLAAIMDHFTRNLAVMEGGSEEVDDAAQYGEGDPEVVAQIKELLETRVRPAVANDGGDITFRGFKDGVVYLNMKGACSGCPSSTATLRHGIQNLLRHFIPDVTEVRPM